MTFMKVMSLPSSHSLQETLRQWWRRDVGFEGPLLRPRTFVGTALHAHFALFGCAPPKELPIQFRNPFSLPPWSSIYTPPKKVDVHMDFRRCLRERTRMLQLRELREATKQSGITQCTQLCRGASGCGAYHKEECFFESSSDYERDIQPSDLCYRSYRNKDAQNVEQ